MDCNKYVTPLKRVFEKLVVAQMLNIFMFHRLTN